jgi:alkaline phosphatase D
MSIKIAFTSCADAETDSIQLIWTEIAAQKPNYVFFLGDLIYMDWGGNSETEKIQEWLTQGEDGLKRFATTMHGRYQKQWTVATFRALLQSIGDETERRKRFHGTWDNHDFAWNGACGEKFGDGMDEMHKSSLVPPRLKTISKRLFEQFVNACYVQPGQYPAFDEKLCDPALALDNIGIQKTIPIHELAGVHVELLDTRWYRQVFVKNTKAKLLGEPQLTDLIRNCKDVNRRMTVIASSVPYQHTYSDLGEKPYEKMEGWSGNGISRPDYDAMQSEVTAVPSLRDRTVFISGDVHKNKWSTDDPTHLRQLSSSPAVVRKIGPLKTYTCFGVLTISETEPVSERLKCRAELFKSKRSAYKVEHTSEWSK